MRIAAFAPNHVTVLLTVAVTVFSMLSPALAGELPTPEQICAHVRAEADLVCKHPKTTQYCQQYRADAEAACAEAYKNVKVNAAVGIDPNARGKDWQASAIARIYGSNRQCDIQTRLMNFSPSDHWDGQIGGYYLTEGRYDEIISKALQTSVGTGSEAFARWMDTNRSHIKRACSESFRSGERVLIGSYDVPPDSFFSTR